MVSPGWASAFTAAAAAAAHGDRQQQHAGHHGHGDDQSLKVHWHNTKQQEINTEVHPHRAVGHYWHLLDIYWRCKRQERSWLRSCAIVLIVLMRARSMWFSMMSFTQLIFISFYSGVTYDLEFLFSSDMISLSIQQHEWHFRSFPVDPQGYESVWMSKDKRFWLLLSKWETKYGRI